MFENRKKEIDKLVMKMITELEEEDDEPEDDEQNGKGSSEEEESEEEVMGHALIIFVLTFDHG